MGTEYLKDRFRIVLLDVIAGWWTVMSIVDQVERAGCIIRRLERYDGFVGARTS